MTFLTPKLVADAKKDLRHLKSDCEAIIWILVHKDADYSDDIAKGYTNWDVINFAASKGTIFLHENIFELSGVEFDESLIPDNIIKDEVLKFYVDYPSDINLIRYLYRNYNDLNDLDALKYEISDRFKVKAPNMLDVINSISHFDSVDYAIAIQDYDHAERAQEFIKILDHTLKNIETKH
ncbi:hypothetical protein VT06_01250 [Arsukibacterium sp. MJ3]|uniref:hypothetical protein n=1 Tax=Arsukibacterium sp. MJ3 TaxID=1632859 RepID=UPI000626ED34|nr:hypothetical protein [Arsukibacterium sp. MJ3]KKO50628.1 hypothetical protein VT06_01250 [Arsukibacterium sp. MJ3]